MPGDPLVSVLVPTVRRPRRLAQALASIGQQTYPHVETIVVNDGGVAVDAIVADYQRTFGHQATLINLPASGGIAHARNAGAQAAHGTLLALLDDDDRYRPEHLARLVATLVDSPEAVVTYDTALIAIEEGDEADEIPNVTATCLLGLPYDRAKFDQDDYLLTSALLIRRADFDAIDGFDETLPFCEDWDLLLRLRQRGELRFVPGEIGVDYSMRIAAGDNSGSTFGPVRQATLDLLSSRYGLPPLAPKTFLDVARDLGCAIVPVGNEAH